MPICMQAYAQISRKALSEKLVFGSKLCYGSPWLSNISQFWERCRSQTSKRYWWNRGM